MKTTNINIINPEFCKKDGFFTPSVSYEMADFNTKTDNVTLVSETMFTLYDAKKAKKVPLAKTITKQEEYMDETSELKYTHTNKYVEKYKVINTTFNTVQADSGVDVKTLYVLAVIPFNGNFKSFNLIANEGDAVGIVTAKNISVDALRFNKEDKVLYSKLCYVLFSVEPNSVSGEYHGFDMNFTTISNKWSEDKTSCTQIERNIKFSVPVDAITNKNPSMDIFIKPEIVSSNTSPAVIGEDGKVDAQVPKFSDLFDIKIDKTVKSEISTKPNFYTKNRSIANRGKGNNNKTNSGDVVNKYFASNKNSNRVNEQPTRRSRKFEDARRRYSEDDE